MFNRYICRQYLDNIIPIIYQKFQTLVTSITGKVIQTPLIITNSNIYCILYIISSKSNYVSNTTGLVPILPISERDFDFLITKLLGGQTGAIFVQEIYTKLSDLCQSLSTPK